jgi:hypothetical protein
MLRLFGIAVIDVGLNSSVVWLLAEILGMDPAPSPMCGCRLILNSSDNLH